MPNDHYLGRVDAPQAVLQDGAWDVPDAWINWDQQPAQHVDDWRLPTTLTLGKIQESMAAPNTISFWELPRFIRALENHWAAAHAASTGIPESSVATFVAGLDDFLCRVLCLAHEPPRRRHRPDYPRHFARQHRSSCLTIS